MADPNNITLRSEKGSFLTYEEADLNFTELQNNIIEQNITVVNLNDLTLAHDQLDIREDLRYGEQQQLVIDTNATRQDLDTLEDNFDQFVVDTNSGFTDVQNLRNEYDITVIELDQLENEHVQLSNNYDQFVINTNQDIAALKSAASLSDEGVYNPSTLYQIGNSVLFDGISYVCVNNDTIGVEPGTDTSRWIAFISKSKADYVSYDNSTSGLSATDVNQAIDEVYSTFDNFDQVDNTSDMNKPVSIPQQAALDAQIQSTKKIHNFALTSGEERVVTNRDESEIGLFTVMKEGPIVPGNAGTLNTTAATNNIEEFAITANYNRTIIRSVHDLTQGKLNSGSFLPEHVGMVININGSSNQYVIIDNNTVSAASGDLPGNITLTSGNWFLTNLYDKAALSSVGSEYIMYPDNVYDTSEVGNTSVAPAHSYFFKMYLDNGKYVLNEHNSITIYNSDDSVFKELELYNNTYIAANTIGLAHGNIVATCNTNNSGVQRALIVYDSEGNLLNIDESAFPYPEHNSKNYSTIVEHSNGVGFWIVSNYSSGSSKRAFVHYKANPTSAITQVGTWGATSFQNIYRCFRDDDNNLFVVYVQETTNTNARALNVAKFDTTSRLELKSTASGAWPTDFGITQYDGNTLRVIGPSNFSDQILSYFIDMTTCDITVSSGTPLTGSAGALPDTSIMPHVYKFNHTLIVHGNGAYIQKGGSTSLMYALPGLSVFDPNWRVYKTEGLPNNSVGIVVRLSINSAYQYRTYEVNLWTAETELISSQNDYISYKVSNIAATDYWYDIANFNPSGYQANLTYFAFSNDSNPDLFSTYTSNGKRDIIRLNNGQWEYNSATAYSNTNWTVSPDQNIYKTFELAMTKSANRVKRSQISPGIIEIEDSLNIMVAYDNIISKTKKQLVNVNIDYLSYSGMFEAESSDYKAAVIQDSGKSKLLIKALVPGNYKVGVM